MCSFASFFCFLLLSLIFFLLLCSCALVSPTLLVTLYSTAKSCITVQLQQTSEGKSKKESECGKWYNWAQLIRYRSGVCLCCCCWDDKREEERHLSADGCHLLLQLLLYTLVVHTCALAIVSSLTVCLSGEAVYPKLYAGWLAGWLVLN